MELDGIVLETATSASLVLSDLAPGPHDVLIQPIAITCTPDWYVPQQIIIEAGQTTPVAFAVRCDTVPAPGLVFSSDRDNPYRNLYRMDLDGGNVQRLTTYSLGDDHPDVSPGGTRIAFLRQAAIGLEQVWLMNADGSQPVKLNSSPHLEQHVEWSPDGQHLAFIRWTAGDLRSLVVSTPDGRLEATIAEGLATDGTAPGAPHWSPDGTRLAFTTILNGRVGIRVVTAMDGGSPVDFLPADTLQEASLSGWTPAGQLLFCRFTPPSPNCELVVASLGGGTEQVLADSVSGLGNAEYSFDGTLIALNAYGPGASFDIYVMPASGGSLTNLTNTTGSHELTPSWLP